MASTSVTTMTCDQCGKREKFDKSFHTVGWIDMSIDTEPEGEREYNWKSFDLCSWSCARDFADDKHAKDEF